MSKNPSYKNTNNSSSKNTNKFSAKNANNDIDCQYLISYNNTPHLIVRNDDDLEEYMVEHIQHMLNNIYYNNIMNYTYFHQPKIIETNCGYEIIENNPFSITNYDNIIATLSYQKLNSI